MSDLIDVTPPERKRPGGRSKAKELPISLLIAEYKAGKTTKQIARQYGYTTTGIEQKCRRYGFNIRTLRAYQAQKADLLAFKQSQIMEAMGPDKIAAASLRDQATAFNILHNAERLERGQSTANVDFHALSMQLSELEAEELKLKKALEALGHKPATSIDPDVGMGSGVEGKEGGEPNAVQR